MTAPRPSADDWSGREILLLRTCTDATLGRILLALRRHFHGARVTLLSSSLQSTTQSWPVESHHVHYGDKRALLAWVRGRHWDVIAVPWTGESVLSRWKVLLPCLSRAQHRVVFNENGDFFRLGRSGLAAWAGHLRWRRRRPIPSRQVRWARVPIETVTGALAIVRMAVRVPVLIGLAAARLALSPRRQGPGS